MKAKYVVAAIAAVGSLCVTLPAFARPATLTAQAGSRINVRSAPTTAAAAPHYGLVGDRIEIMRSTFGKDGNQWYYVRFASGAQGWVRNDFVQYGVDRAKYAVLGGKAGDRINVRSAPSTKASSPHYGMEGDVVQVIKYQEGRDGHTWQYVQFPSGARGWVRGDLVNMMDEEGC